MSLRALFAPSSIAVIGASTRAGTVGNDLLKNLISYGYRGQVFPINPKATQLLGLTCYPDIASLPLTPDLAIIAIPAAAVPEALEQAGQKGVGQAVIISAGFRETGPEGAEREDDLIRIATGYGITLLGPNCLGFIHPQAGLNASFAKQMPAPGNIAFFSQSGALSTALLDMTGGELGFSHFVSAGNKALLSEADFLSYFKDVADTQVVGFYSEAISDANRFIQAGRTLLAAEPPKPVLALKSGASEAGTRASSSHTGSLAGSDAAYSALFRQAGIQRCQDFEELLETLRVFSLNPLPRGRRVAIVTNAGGLGVLATDALAATGLDIEPLPAPVQDKLRAFLPPAASAQNPVDVLGDAPAERYRETLTVLARAKAADMLLLIVTPQSMTEGLKTAQALVDFRDRAQIPVAAVFSGADSFPEAEALLRTAGIATYRFAESGARALASLAAFTARQAASARTPFLFTGISHTQAKDVIHLARKENRLQLSADESQAVLSAYGFRFPESASVTSLADAQAAAETFSQPFALKIISPDIIHKSDAGGVRLDVTQETLAREYEALMRAVKEKAPQARIDGVYMGEMAPSGGKELLLGIKEEPGLGKLVAAGLGGIYTEVFRDASFRFAPIAKEDAREMLGELKSQQLLAGARGEAPIDQDAIQEALGRLSALATDFPEIRELDINPLLVFPDGAENLALDARILLTTDKPDQEQQL